MRWWQVCVLALSFVLFVGFGFTFRRVVHGRDILDRGVEACRDQQDPVRQLRGLSQRTHQVLEAATSAGRSEARRGGDFATPPAESFWGPLEAWASEVVRLEPPLLEFLRQPDWSRMAALRNVTDSNGRPCVSGSGDGTEEVNVAGALAGLEAPGLSLAAVRVSAARGCRAMLATVTERVLDGDKQLSSARKVVTLLAELAQPGTAQQRMQQLRVLHTELSSTSDLLSSPIIAGPERPLPLDPAGLLRVRQQLPDSELLALDCLPQTTVQLRRLLAALYDDELAATGMFIRGEETWLISPEIARMAAVLDAFSELEFVKRASPEHCDIKADLASSRWDAGALQRFDAILSDYSKSGQLLKLNAAAKDARAADHREFWMALPDAACGKIVQNLCVELNDTLVPVTTRKLPDLTRLRIQANSLVKAHPIWVQIKRHAEQFGCSEGGFGLAEADRYAAALLRGADDALEQLDTDITDRMSASLGLASSVGLAQDPKVVEAELRRVRLEVSALALGIAEPALAHLSIGKPRASLASGWVALLDDLALPVAGKRGGAMASDGQSGLFAYERLYGEALKRAPRTCELPLEAWSKIVFVKAGMFYDLGREQSAELVRRCAALDSPPQG